MRQLSPGRLSLPLLCLCSPATFVAANPVGWVVRDLLQGLASGTAGDMGGGAQSLLRSGAKLSQEAKDVRAAAAKDNNQEVILTDAEVQPSNRDRDREQEGPGRGLIAQSQGGTSPTSAWNAGSEQLGTSPVEVVESPSDLPDASVRFLDTDGDKHSLAADTGLWRWCTTPGNGNGAEDSIWRCHTLREVIGRYASGCSFEVTLLPPSVESGWRALVADPSPGPMQEQLAQKLLDIAQKYRVRLTGYSRADLDAPEPSGASAVAQTLQPPLTFYAPIGDPHSVAPNPNGGDPSDSGDGAGNSSAESDPDAGRSAPQESERKLLVELPGIWKGDDANAICAALVERPEDCNACAFAGKCPSKLSNRSRLGENIVLEVPRPSFSRRMVLERADKSNHSLCIRGSGPLMPNQTKDTILLVGRLEYYPLPKVKFVQNVLGLAVRTFLNPGWHEEITLECTNCSSNNRLWVQPLDYDSSCKGAPQQSLAQIAAAVRHGQVPRNVQMPPHNGKVDEIFRSGGSQASLAGTYCNAPEHGPCTGLKGTTGGVVPFHITGGLHESSTDTKATFLLESTRRLLARERQALFHRRSALCFYPSEGYSDGWLVGFVAVHMDGPDMQAFIGFVCFFGVALPLICLVTALLHYNKYERCKQHLQQLRLEYQREQLEQEMQSRNLGPVLASGAPRLSRPPAPSRPPANTGNSRSLLSTHALGFLM